MSLTIDREAKGLGELRSPRELREVIRAGRYEGNTSGLLPGYTQVSFVAVPEAFAADFLRFCVRNWRACPIVDVTDPGDPEPRHAALGADLRTDMARYRVYRHGDLAGEPSDVLADWRDDMVGFLFGCSATLEGALTLANIPWGSQAIYTTDIECAPAGPFNSRLVVTMRALAGEHLAAAVQVTSRYPMTHGAPIHVGDPGAIGIDLMAPDAVGPEGIRLAQGETPLFWACSVTAERAALAARPDLVISFEPGKMFVTDLQGDALTR